MTFEEFENYAGQGNLIPVYSTYMADLLTPVSAYLRLQQASSRAFLLESVEGGEKSARFSFLGFEPFSTIRVSDGWLEIEDGPHTRRVQDNIFDYLAKRLEEYRPVRPDSLPRFTGGAVGYFGYETIRYIEDIPVQSESVPGIPEAVVMLFDTVLAFDHLRHQIYIIKNVFLPDGETNLRDAYAQAQVEIGRVAEMLDVQIPQGKANVSQNGYLVESNFREEDFKAAVERAKEYIASGDIFQVVLSQRFSRPIDAAPFAIYRALRVVNPSPYLYFMQMDDCSIIGSSPELLVRVEEGQVEVRPIAGTRPRGGTEAEDARLQAELAADEKEKAEHVMLVDLGRNDVGKVSTPGSVAVNEFMTVEKYSHVMHLVSNVRGKLKPNLTALDALKSCFPAGTVSGAPKIRAMEIISELENERRGVYAGALGYLDFAGNLDTCIAIRTILTSDGHAYFQAGAGIVADSVPQREFEETEHKAAALRAAIEFAEMGMK